ncbi:MAG: hypothetical protein HC923_10415 [Myxococcales bacterium]|nr:hypothetical protein [Myxococcales bacterium]
MLESVALGSTRPRGLARAQARGIAEADSVLDLDGWDSAAKAALLANVWFEGNLRIVDVARVGIEDLKDNHIRETAKDGTQFRQVVSISRGPDDRPVARVEVEPISLADPLHTPMGSLGALHVVLERGLAFTWHQGTSGLDDAALGLLGDLEAAKDFHERR